jgi:hypothetical protein
VIPRLQEMYGVMLNQVDDAMFLRLAAATKQRAQDALAALAYRCLGNRTPWGAELNAVLVE